MVIKNTQRRILNAIRSSKMLKGNHHGTQPTIAGIANMNNQAQDNVIGQVTGAFGFLGICL